MPENLPTIGWVRHNFLPASETFIHAALRSLTDEGVRIRVLAINRRNAEKFPYDDVTALTDGPMGLLEAGRYWLTGSSPLQREWLKSVKLLHAHMGYTAAHALHAAKRARIPLVTSFYGRDVTLAGSSARLLPQYLRYTVLQQRLFAEGDRFLVLSQHMREALVAQGCPDQKIRIVRIGIDTERFSRAPEDTASPKSEERGRTSVLMVGREVEKKGFDDGLSACARARQLGADIEVVLLGTGDELLPSLKRQAAALDLPVAWPDPSTRVAQAMRSADILLVPSRTAANGDQEGTPTVICEGSASQLPIVATRHAGIPDQVDDGETGILADERDVEAMATAIARLAADPEQCARMGRAGASKMQAQFSIQAHRDALAQVYAELLRERSPA